MSLIKPGIHRAESEGVGGREEGHRGNQKLLFSFKSLADQICVVETSVSWPFCCRQSQPG